MQNHKQDIVCHRIQELFQYTHKIEHQKSNLLHTTPTFFFFFRLPQTCKNQTAFEA